MESERQASDKLRALIDERVAAALANERGATCVSLLSAATAFAQLDDRLATMDAHIDQRIQAALSRNEHEHLEAVASVVRDVLADFIGEFRQLRKIIEGKLAQTPFDPAAHKERPN